MMRASNHLIGFLNFMTFLLSVPILGGGIWLSSRANNTDCLKFLQWPLIVIGVAIMVVSLAGFAGACYRNTFLMWLYLFAMFIIIAVLIGFIIFAYAVTDKGSGHPVPNRAYSDYYLEDYSGWLKDRVVENNYWVKIVSCIRDSKACSKMGRTINGVPETFDMFSSRKLNPIESGCCKPPSECGYTYVNETTWTQGGGSCKAGVLGSLKKSWRKVSVINIVVLIILVIVYVIACAAFRNNKRIDNDEPYGEARMTKSQPSRIHFKYCW
ncbi:hypothetical protein FNV43_RR03520 [Rhamnella rubrinervis]|uniref:Tetraspanin n=1 Tax=Rhamnella rubrinervis TaxID=2594499 RepID=A0A8K0HIJ8_9ROSA|nr:hypothetical protein FNV43_RR03520 [Rhamnella rubrinervis]